MSKTFNISIVGAGNLASNLAPQFENAGHIINTICSLHLESAQKLANSLYNTRAIDDGDLSQDNSQFIFLAVKDDIIYDLAADLILPENSVLIHCSGFADIERLDSYQGPKAVFYPLQSFSKNKRLDFSNIPICIESYDDQVVEDLMELGKSISKTVSFVPGNERKMLHLSAVFANNFVNHLLLLSQRILKDTNLDISLLHPLVQETVKKAFENGPDNAQTGPAKRGDLETVHAQLEMIRDDNELSELYELITKQILENH